MKLKILLLSGMLLKIVIKFILFMFLFFYNTNFTLPNKRPVKKWLTEVVKQTHKKVGQINIVFCNDEQLLVLNKQFLNHNALTDILTFDSSDKKFLHADIYISIDRVIENARKYKNNFEEELRRVMVHGILHLCGYKDKKIVDRQLMKQKEDEALTIFNSLFNY